MIKPRAIAILTLGITTLVFCGCKKPFSDREQNNSVYRHSENGAPVTMDPTSASTIYENLMVTTIYDQLYEYKYLAKPYELKPRLAASLPEVSEDGLVYIFRIKQDIRYSDNPCFPDGKGREVIAQDFIYSMKRMFDPKNLPQGEWVWKGKIKGLDEWKAAGSDYSKNIEGLKAIDDHTLQVTLNAPFPQLTYTLAMGYSSVVPREAVEHYGKEFALNPVGSGPYRLETFSTRRAVFVRNENYREEYFDLEYEGYNPKTQAWAKVDVLDGMRIPVLDKVEVHFMEESMTRWNSLNKGNEIHYGAIPIELTHMVADQLKPLKLKPDYAEKFTGINLADFGFVHLPINMADPRIGHHKDPEQNRRNRLLRKAIRAAFDWEQRNERFYNDIGIVFPGIIPPGLDAHDPKLPRHYVTADYEQAKQYLKEGGWTPENLPELTYGGTASVQTIQVFEQFRGWLEQIGYPRDKVTIRTFATFGDYNRAVRNKELTFMPGGWGLDYPDSENVLQLFYGPNKSPGANSSNYDNPEFNELFRKTKPMQPGPERSVLYREMNEIVLEDVPTVAGLMRNSPAIWYKNVVILPSKNPHGSLLKYVYMLPELTEGGEH